MLVALKMEEGGYEPRNTCGVAFRKHGNGDLTSVAQWVRTSFSTPIPKL